MGKTAGARQIATRISRSLALIFATLLLTACSDLAGLLPQVDEPSSASLILMNRGSTLQPGRTFTPITPRLQLSGEYRNTPPDRALITLLDREFNHILDIKEFSGDLGDPQVLEAFNASPGQSANLEIGLYYYRAELFLDQSLISSQDTPVFVVPEHPRVVSLSSYPSALISGGYGLLRAQVIAPNQPELQDPYLVWTMDGEVIGQGLLSEGAAAKAVLAPSRPGVIRAEVQVYPFKPLFEGEFDFVAPVSRTMEVVVVPVPASRDSDLGPASQYSTLLHLNGSLENSGTAQESSFTSTKQLLPGIRDEVFGYEFLPDRWLESSSFLLPLSGSRQILNTGIVFAGSLDFLPTENRVLLFSTSSGAWKLEFWLSPDGRLGFAAGAQSTNPEIYSPPAVVSEGEHVFSANIYRISSTSYGVVLFVDGMLRGGGVFAPPSQAQLAGPGSSIIAAGFAGVLDEFGISAAGTGQAAGKLASGLYHKTMTSRYGANLEYAVSFEDGSMAGLPAGTRTSSGGLSTQPGRLILQPGQWLQLPDMALQADSFDIHLGLVPDSDWKFGYLSLELASATELHRIVVGMDGFVRTFGSQGSQVAGRILIPDPADLRLNVGLNPGSLSASGGTLELALPQGVESVRLRIDQAVHADDSLDLDHIAAVQPFRDLIPGLLE